VMRAAGDGAHDRRLRGLIVILWRAGLRIQEALALTEADLDPKRGSLLVRRGKGGRRRDADSARKVVNGCRLFRIACVGPLSYGPRLRTAERQPTTQAEEGA